MSNRAALITIMTDLDAIDERLRAVSGRTVSIMATCQIAASRDCLTRAKLRLAASLAAVDPIVDLVVIDAPGTQRRAGAVS